MIKDPTDRRTLRERLMTPTEVAALFCVSVPTVIDWAQAGKVRSVRTPGGRYRFRGADVDAMVGIDAMAVSA